MRHQVLLPILALALSTLPLSADTFFINLDDSYDVISGNTPQEGNPQGYELCYKSDRIDGSTVGSDSGSAADLFNTIYSDGGLTATITWVGSQPYLEILYVKAAHGYVIVNLDELGFNDGSYDSIVVTNTGAFTNRGNGSCQAISHVQLEGCIQVPDAASTLTLLGIALTGLGLFARRRTNRV